MTHDAASPDTRKGRPTLIILDRDGSLHHYPPGRALPEPRHARVVLHEPQLQPTLIDRIIDFAFDVLGIDILELRIYEHPER